jgi:Protein of unknown function (DUF2384)
MFGEMALDPRNAINLHGVAWNQPADLSSRAVQEKLSPVAIRAFFLLASHWKLRDEDARSLIGGMSNGSFYQLKRSSATNLGIKTTGSRAPGVKTPGVKTLDQDRLTRVSLLVGIFKALNILYSNKLADTWVQLPNSNPIFGGQTPLAYMLRGGLLSMFRVRQLLDARRGGV